MSHGYAVTNLLTGLSATAFTWSSAYTGNRDRLNDGLQDAIATSNGSSTSQTLAIDLGSARAVGGLALLGHNFATWTAPTLTVVAADDAGFSSGLVTAKSATTLNVAAPGDRDTVLTFASLTKRYWRITFADSSARTVTLGEVLLFAAPTTLTRRKAWGWGESEKYVQNRVTSRTGFARVTQLAGPVRTKRLPFDVQQGTSQLAELRTMWRATRGGALNLLWIEEVETTSAAAASTAQDCLWCKMAPAFGWTESDYTLFAPDAFELVGLGREVGS